MAIAVAASTLGAGALAIAPASAVAPTGDAAAGGVTYRMTVRLGGDGPIRLDRSLAVSFTTPDGRTGSIDLGSLAENWLAAGLAERAQASIAGGRLRGTAIVQRPRLRGDGTVALRISLGQRTRSADKTATTTTITLQSSGATPACPTSLTAPTPFTGDCQGVRILVGSDGTKRTVSLCLLLSAASKTPGGQVAYAVTNPALWKQVGVQACGGTPFTTTYTTVFQACPGTAPDPSAPLGVPACSPTTPFLASIR